MKRTGRAQVWGGAIQVMAIPLAAGERASRSDDGAALRTRLAEALRAKGPACAPRTRHKNPDVDAVYMTFLQAFTGNGGWPMTVWLTPEREPFFGGTYFPPRAPSLSALVSSPPWHAEQPSRAFAWTDLAHFPTCPASRAA